MIPRSTRSSTKGTASPVIGEPAGNPITTTSTGPMSSIWVSMEPTYGRACEPASPRSGEIVEQADATGLHHGLRTRRRVELAVDGVRVGLDRVRRDVQEQAHLAEGQVGREQAK